MHRVGPEPKRTTDSRKKRNERTLSSFLDPIVMFWFVLVSFVIVQKKHAGIAFNAPIRARTEMNYRFTPKTKRTHPINLFGPNSDVLVRFGQFCYSAKNHAGIAFNAPIRARTEMNYRFAPKTKPMHPI